MRSDMTKVLVERPRIGGGYARDRDRKELDRMPPDEWRTHEGMRARWKGRRKSFNDHLGPLRRYLLSNVGRPWNLVFSEICREIRGGFPVREHFLLHVNQHVEKCVILIDGVPCYGQGRVFGTPLNPRWRPSLYVCPKSGLLRKVADRRKPKH